MKLMMVITQKTATRMKERMLKEVDESLAWAVGQKAGSWLVSKSHAARCHCAAGQH